MKDYTDNSDTSLVSDVPYEAYLKVSKDVLWLSPSDLFDILSNTDWEIKITELIMDINNIPTKQDVNPVSNSTTQISAEEFNCIVETIKKAVINKLGILIRNGELYITHKLAGSTEVLEIQIPNATTSTPGIISKDDKNKLDKLSPNYPLVSQTINGENYNVATDENESLIIFAPTEAGSEGYILASTGSGAPQWIPQADIKAGDADRAGLAGIATKASQDSMGRVISDTYLTKEELGDIGTTAQEAKQIAEKASQDVATQESTIADIQETIENISAEGVATNAASVTYNSVGGSLTSTNVQNALTEVAGRLDDLDEASGKAVKNNEISEVRHIVNGVEYKTIVPPEETNNMDFVAPTEAGTQGHILQSSGDKSTPPTWADPTDLHVGSADSAAMATSDGDGNNIADTYATKTALDEVKELAGDREATSERMGYIILDPDKTFAEQVNEKNTIYEIRDDFDLGGKVVDERTVSLDEQKTINGTSYYISSAIDIPAGQILTVPDNCIIFNYADNPKDQFIQFNPYVPISNKQIQICIPTSDSSATLGMTCEYSIEKAVQIPTGCTFRFNGGSIGNGAITLQDISIYGYDSLVIEAGPYHIFKGDLRIEGSFSSNKVHIEWFGAVGDGKTDCTDAFRKAIKMNETKNNGSYDGRGYNIYLNSNRTYVVTGTINYYDETYHEVHNIAFVGDKAVISQGYAKDKNRPCQIQLSANDTSLFKNATQILNMTLRDISISGLWTNWVASNIKLFDECILKSLLLTNCMISYIHTMFYDTGVWGVSRIHNNRFIGVYNFSLLVNHPSSGDDKYAQFVDSSIYNNYINGGAPASVAVIDNAFFTWTTSNGSEIHHNFIDYYCTMYKCNLGYGNINSNHNHYQVFNYFHTNVELLSVNDYFNWNDPDYILIKDVMAKYANQTTGTGIVIPPYIATDRYSSRSVVFKDMVLEEHLKNIVLRTGTTDITSAKGKRFIVELHEHSNARNGAIVYAAAASSAPEGFPVYLQTAERYECKIDKKLAHIVDAMPTNYVYGSWGKYGIGEYIYCNKEYYKMSLFWGNSGIVGYDFIKEIPANSIAGFAPGTTAYVNSNSLEVRSEVLFVSTRWSQTSEARYKVNSLTFYESLRNKHVTLHFDGLIIFSTFKNRYGGELTLNAGDSLTLMYSPNGEILVLGYYCAAENNTTGLTTARPSAPSTGQCFFDTTLGKPIWWNGTEWINTEVELRTAGTWSQRPNADGTVLENGFQFFLLESTPDTDPEGQPIESITGNGKPIWWIQDSQKWVDAFGNTVTGGSDVVNKLLSEVNEVRHIINGEEYKFLTTEDESHSATIYAPSELMNDGYIVAQQGNTAAFVDPSDIGLK